MLVASAALAAVLATVLIFLLVALDAQSESDSSARHSEMTTAAAVQLKSSLLDLETGTRGYVITRRSQFLDPWRDARREIPREIRALEGLVRGVRGQEGRAAEIAQLIEAYVRDWSVPLVRLAARSPRAAARRIATGDGKRRVDSLREDFDNFIGYETAVGAARRQSARATARRAVAIGVIGLAGSILLVAMYFFYLVRSIVRPVRRVATAASGLAQGDLTARVPRGRGGGETAQLGRVFNRMAASLEDSRDRLQLQNTELEDQRGELVAAVARLAAEKARVERFLRFGRRIAGETERDRLCDVILEDLVELASADYGVVYARDDASGGELELSAARGISRDAVPARLRDADDPGHRAALERRVTRGTEGRDRQSPDGREISDELHVPLVQGDRALGVVSLARTGGAAFAPSSAEAVEDLAGQAAVTLGSSLALRSAREQATVIRAVLDATPDAIALLDRDGNAVVDNPPSHGVRSALVESARADLEAEISDEVDLPGGRTFARYAAPVRDPAGRFIGRLVVMRDITGERQAEKMKDEFFALVSHELRTPLTSIVGYLELVLDDDGKTLDPEHRGFLHVVERNAGRLLRLVGDLLFVAQIEAGQLSLDPGLVDLGQLVREAVEAARPRAEESEIVLVTDVEPVPTCPGDPDRLGQVLDNLTANALKFTPPGGRVEVRLRTSGAAAVIEVADNGVGIPEGEQSQLFERFFRASTATDRAIPGVGLGLTIVKAIVEAHGGHVSLSSREGAGTTFRVELPLGPWAPSESTSRERAPAAQDADEAAPAASPPRGR
jgi:signal transduction histidine kinase/CHASE3 domain sensor protein